MGDSKPEETAQKPRLGGPEQHRNDMYGEVDATVAQTAAIPAATVVLLRDRRASVEVLMLRKNSKIAFGGMWVFPGGRIDPGDHSDDRGLETAARFAAAREAEEEAGVRPDPSTFVWFSHWSPPPSTRRRFATYFFTAKAPGSASVAVDGGEILEHRWITPTGALEKHAAGEIDLAPPTWVTLFQMSRFAGCDEAIDHLSREDPRVYETHVAARQDGVRVAIWDGDSGYQDWDADAEGERHRLVMARGGFVFEHPAGWY